MWRVLLIHWGCDRVLLECAGLVAGFGGRARVERAARVPASDG